MEILIDKVDTIEIITAMKTVVVMILEVALQMEPITTTAENTLQILGQTTETMVEDQDLETDSVIIEIEEKILIKIHFKYKEETNLQNLTTTLERVVKYLLEICLLA